MRARRTRPRPLRSGRPAPGGTARRTRRRPPRSRRTTARISCFTSTHYVEQAGLGLDTRRVELHSRRVLSLATYLADKDPQHVPGVVLAGVVLGTILLWAAIRAMFGK